MGCCNTHYTYNIYKQNMPKNGERIFSIKPLRYQFDISSKENLNHIQFLKKIYNINNKENEPIRQDINDSIHLFFESDECQNNNFEFQDNNNYFDYEQYLNDISQNNTYNENIFYKINQQEIIPNIPNTSRVRKLSPLPCSVIVENDYDIYEEINKKLSELEPPEIQISNFPKNIPDCYNSAQSTDYTINCTNYPNNIINNHAKVRKLENINNNTEFKAKKAKSHFIPYQGVSRNPRLKNNNHQSSNQKTKINLTKIIPPEVVSYVSQLEFKELEDFDPELWRKICPEEENFFIYNKGSFINTQMTSLNNENETETYIGEVNQYGEKNGSGKLISPSKKRIGTWRKNSFTGWGREVRKGGEIYEGKFIDGELIGKGIYKSEDELYIGDFYKFIKHGNGDLFIKKFHYKGSFNNGKRGENGRIEYKNNGVNEG